MAKGLGKGRVRVYAVAEFSEADAVDHRRSDLRYHVACWTAHEGRPEYLISAFAAVDLVDAISRLANCPIALIKEFRISLKLDTLLLQSHFIHAD